jgi:hypothetical protein
MDATDSDTLIQTEDEVLFVCHGNIFLKSEDPHKNWAREEWRPVLGQF